MTDPRTGWHPSLLPPRQAAPWWLAAGLLVVGLWAVSVQLAPLTQQPQLVVVAGLLLGTVGVLYVLLIGWLDPLARKPASLLAGALIWGGVIATTLFLPAGGAIAGLLPKLGSLQLAQQWGPAIVAAPTEEGGKLLGVIAIALLARQAIKTPLDGMVYGAMVGLGFQLVETAQYLLGPASQAQGAGQVVVVFAVLLERMVVPGILTHMAFTAISGWGWATTSPDPRCRGRGG